ncbi:WhiB family transcriptional regulator [Timonella sp. A28]|uniref:WhiB family transcriptional regulator n=1 Tax=Timonella sp. A28 TaxID=3442640 RepID=UPI003EBDD1A5
MTFNPYRPETQGTAGVESWMEAAACKGSSVDFHSDVVAEIYAAKEVCASCPVKRECLASADAYGIWGGLGPVERAGKTWRPRGSQHTKPLPVIDPADYTSMRDAGMSLPRIAAHYNVSVHILKKIRHNQQLDPDRSTI